MSELPAGTITFLFTDIEDSTRLWEQYPEAMRTALADHDDCLRAAIETGHGHVFKTVGDQFCAVFAQATDALYAAISIQKSLCARVGAPLAGARSEGEAHPGGVPLPVRVALQVDAAATAVESVPLRVRVVLHTGTAEAREGDYFGPTLNRVARLLPVGHGGQVLLSQTAADLVRQDLPAGVSLCDLGLHRLRDLRRPEHIYQLVHPDLPGQFPPLRSLDTVCHNLPQQVTSFVGRDQEIAEVRRLLLPRDEGRGMRDEGRLLTLTGPGGTGKTRLALEAAAGLRGEYEDGVWLVELAALADPALVPHAVAAVLGVPEERGLPLVQKLVESLQPRKLLLVLDNCEHLLTACAGLADTVARSCPNIRILATSRERLNIPSEQTYRVPCLSTPDTRGQRPTPERLTRFEAVRLFLDRARLIQPSFTMTSHNAPFVARVCHQLEGIPLLLELAAARLGVLSIEQMNQRLADRLRLLTGGSRTALPRQQTLRATLDWSYDLLAEAEQRLLRRLSVFAGGFTLEAVETVCAGHGIERGAVTDLLGRLVDKSLVERVEQAGGGCRLLETIRQYGREKLREQAEEVLFRARHAAYYLALAERAEPELTGPAQGEWLDCLEQEHDNLRATLDWAVTGRNVELGLRLGGALWRFWEVRGYRAEGRERLTALLALAEEAPPESGGPGRDTLRARALQGLGVVAYFQGDYGAAQAALEESLTISRRLGDRRAVAASLRYLGEVSCARGEYTPARALFEQARTLQIELGDRRGIRTSLASLAWVAREQGDLEAARSLLEQSLAVCRELNATSGIAYSLNSLGETCYLQGDLSAARLYLEESLRTWRELGDQAGIAWSLHDLGVAAGLGGDDEEAQSLCEQSLAMQRELGDKWAIAGSLNALGRLARNQGNGERAAALCREGLTLAWEQGNKRCIAECLEGVASAVMEMGVIEAASAGAASGNRSPSAERAARLFGAALSLRNTIGSPLPPVHRADHARSLADARAVLGEDTFAAAWAEGQAMPLQQVVLAASAGAS